MEQFVKQINDRGTLTFPPEIRKHLNLEGGDHVSFKITPKGTVEISKVQIEIKQVETKPKSPKK